MSYNTGLPNNLATKKIIGRSQKIQELLNLVNKISDTDSTILITGESGTGKELIAKALHYNSSRKNNLFVPINCGAIPSELLESELFGHVKGAFTGAINNRIGRFELANGGTILLDEIGEMSPTLQVKLLRILQEKKFEPVGSIKSIEADVRVIASTNIDLEKAVREGRFREDLFYRLNVIPVQIPSLRERIEDIPILFNYFVTIFNKTKKRNISGISNEALEALMKYDWPGNIRELENLVERLTILISEGEIKIYDLPPKYQNINMNSFFKSNQLQSLQNEFNININELPEKGIDFNSLVDAYENSLIIQALEKTNWNRNQAAHLLKLNRTTLVEKIKKKGLKPEELNVKSELI